MPSQAGQQQWNPINEVAENNEAKNADADYQALLRKPLDLDGVKSAMWWIWEVDPKTGRELAANALAEEKSKEPKTDEIDWGDAFDETTNINETPESREKNREKAEKLLLSPENLQAQIQSLWSKDPRKTKEYEQWVEGNLEEWGPLVDSFARIKWNFTLPDEIRWESMSEIFNDNPTNAFTVNKVLAHAIDRELQEHVLKWKVNYPAEKVESIIKTIYLEETTPIKKIMLFWEIYSTVNTNIAKWAKKLSEADIAKKKLGAQNAQQEQQFRESQASQINKHNIEKDTSQNIESPKEADIIKSWDIFAGWTDDALSIWGESTQKAA